MLASGSVQDSEDSEWLLCCFQLVGIATGAVIPCCCVCRPAILSLIRKARADVIYSDFLSMLPKGPLVYFISIFLYFFFISKAVVSLRPPLKLWNFSDGIISNSAFLCGRFTLFTPFRRVVSSEPLLEKHYLLSPNFTSVFVVYNLR